MERNCVLAQSPHGVFPVILGQFTSVTYPRRTGGNDLAARNNEAQGRIQDFF